MEVHYDELFLGCVRWSRLLAMLEAEPSRHNNNRGRGTITNSDKHSSRCEPGDQRARSNAQKAKHWWVGGSVAFHSPSGYSQNTAGHDSKGYFQDDAQQLRAQ